MDWREYQEKVAEFFRRMGATAQTNQTVEGSRGIHDIDVLITFNLWGQKIVWVAECKLWKSAVPKEKVLTLYQITQDVGADRGFLFSEKGFQSGAIKVTSNTNITLTSLEEIKEITKEDLYNTCLLKALQQMNEMKNKVKDLWIDDLHNPKTYKDIPFDEVLSLDGTLLFLSLTIQKGLDKKFPITFHSLNMGIMICKSEDELIEGVNVVLNELKREVGRLSLIASKAKEQILQMKNEFINSVKDLLLVGNAALFPNDYSKFEELRLAALSKMYKVGQTSEELKEISRGSIRLELHNTMRLLIDTIYLYLTQETIDAEVWGNANENVLNALEKMQQFAVE
jgi:hypothetical protein